MALRCAEGTRGEGSHEGPPSLQPRERQRVPSPAACPSVPCMSGRLSQEHWDREQIPTIQCFFSTQNCPHPFLTSREGTFYSSAHFTLWFTTLGSKHLWHFPLKASTSYKTQKKEKKNSSSFKWQQKWSQRLKWWEAVHSAAPEDALSGQDLAAAAPKLPCPRPLHLGQQEPCGAVALPEGGTWHAQPWSTKWCFLRETWTYMRLPQCASPAYMCLWFQVRFGTDLDI